MSQSHGSILLFHLTKNPPSLSLIYLLFAFKLTVCGVDFLPFFSLFYFLILFERL